MLVLRFQSPFFQRWGCVVYTQHSNYSDIQKKDISNCSLVILVCSLYIRQFPVLLFLIHYNLLWRSISSLNWSKLNLKNNKKNTKYLKKRRRSSSSTKMLFSACVYSYCINVLWGDFFNLDLCIKPFF